MARLPSFNEALALATAGAAAASPRGRRAALRVGRTGFRITAAIAKRHPAIATAVVLAELGYIFEEDIREVASDLRERLPAPVSGQGGSPTFSGESIAPKVKRKLSKANKAMQQAMKVTKNNFKQATKIASKANPRTKSKIGKGATKVKKLARKIRKSVWGTLRRKK